MQAYSGVLEIGRVDYSPLNDMGGYAGSGAQEDIRQALRHYLMLPKGRHFRPDAAATRAELAAALLMGARVPLYVAGQPMFSDVTDAWLRSYVESVQTAPGGAIFPGVRQGGAFNPSGQLDRLTAAVALVRAAGLEAEAEASAVETPGYTDANLIPSEWRGHVVVAVRRGLINAPAGGAFNPQQPLTRAQLAAAMARIAALFAETPQSALISL
jgi:hypothetical protein